MAKRSGSHAPRKSQLIAKVPTPSIGRTVSTPVLVEFRYQIFWLGVISAFTLFSVGMMTGWFMRG